MRILLVSILFITSSYLSAQNNIEISEMKWGADFNIHITFSNDSTTIHDVKALYHTNDNIGTKNEVTYYPVSLDPSFVENLKSKHLDQLGNQGDVNNNDEAQIKTLWNSLHPTIGGGYIHFINSIIYAIESGKLNLMAPLMKRPESDWKPKPMTESFRRTQKWNYYTPDNQKLAIKEYKIQEKNKELGDIKILPSNFIELFLNTNDKQYVLYQQNKELNKIATIEMIKLMIGSRYLGSEQIDYIQGAVIKAIMQYNINNLPSVIIFDNYNAAVAMTLDSEGYKIDKVVFDEEQSLSSSEMDQRLKKMERVIHEINEVNKEVFEKKLKSYYTN